MVDGEPGVRLVSAVSKEKRFYIACFAEKRVPKASKVTNFMSQFLRLRGNPAFDRGLCTL